eukprot:484290_1
MMTHFEYIRNKFLDLWTIITKSDNDDIPAHIVEFDKSFSLSPINKHRIYRRNHGTKSKFQNANSSKDTKYFWNTKFINWDKEPYSFTGLDSNEHEHFMETILSRLVMYVDRLKSIFVQYDDKPGNVNTIRDILRSRKVLEILYKDMFGSSIDTVQTLQNPKVMLKMLSLEDQQRKLVMRLRTTFGSCILKFLSANTEWKRIVHQKKLKIQISPKWIPGHGNKSAIFRSELSWNLHVFYEPVSFDDMALFDTTNKYIKFLLKSDDVAENVKFNQIVLGYNMHLVNLIFEYKRYGGRCGIRNNDGNNKKNEYVESFICELPWTGMAKTSTINQVTIPRKFVQRGIRNTEEYDWVLLSDVSGLKFEDISAAETDSDASSEDITKVDHHVW